MSKFQGILAYINRPSDSASGGSQGFRVRILPSAAQNIVDQAKGTYFTYDHINFLPDLYPESIIGHIEEAVIVDDLIVISGYVKDEWVAKHKDEKFGISLEAHADNVKINYWDETLDVPEFRFRGASIVEKPAYTGSTFEILDESY